MTSDLELNLTGPRRAEAVLTSDNIYAAPCWDVELKAEITGPEGRTYRRPGFWDGGTTWRIRFRVDRPGRWQVRTHASDAGNGGLHGLEGSIDVPSLALAAHPLGRHGPLRLSENRRYLVHEDGTPFFWLADTAWNGVMKAGKSDWERYLTVRRQQGFNVVQAVLTQWRAFGEDLRGERAFHEADPMEISPAFHRRLDDRIEMIADHGLVPALVQLWAYGETDPGQHLSETDAIQLGRYQVARYGHLPVVWLLGGDGYYAGEHAPRWQRIGRGIFGREDEDRQHLVTLHPRGRHWAGEDFRREPWYDLVAYQSSHGQGEETLKWLLQGPPASCWDEEPVLPVINQEPCYEAIAYGDDQPLEADPVRRALYWSLLNAPTAGVTYGHHGVWPWQEHCGVPLGHRTCEAPSWREGLQADGARCVTHLKHFVSRLRWWALRPAPELLVEQPGREDLSRFVTAARSEDGDLAVCYLPSGGEIRLEAGRLPQGARISWFNPRDGSTLPAGAVGSTERLTLTAPDENDWALCIGH